MPSVITYPQVMPFHVRVSTDEPHRRLDHTDEAFSFHNEERELRERFVEPWINREEIVCDGLTFSPERVRVAILKDPNNSSQPFIGRSDWGHARSQDDVRPVTDDFLIRRVSAASTTAKVDNFRAKDPARVMVVHGRDSAPRDDLFNLLKALGLKPIAWREAVKATGKGAPFNAEAVEAAFGMAQAAVILFTPDEQVLLRTDLRDPKAPDESRWAWQARPNVFYEGGIAFTSHPERTIVVEFGRARVPSDLEGRNAVRIRSGPEWRQELAERLSGAGCPVSSEESEWLGVGQFVEPHLTFASDDPSVATNSVPSHGGPEDQLVRLLREIAEAHLPNPPAADVVTELARRLRSLKGSTRGHELFKGLPGRQLPNDAVNSMMHDLIVQRVLVRNPDQSERGWVIGELP